MIDAIERFKTKYPAYKDYNVWIANSDNFCEHDTYHIDIPPYGHTLIVDDFECMYPEYSLEEITLSVADMERIVRQNKDVIIISHLAYS